MAKIISVEKSKYINANIEIYSQNKVGQYSKFLNKNPIFVTYYSINLTESRSDVGTGGIQSEVGTSSPIRFNKIKDLPIYNLPTINPDIDYDETGYDLNIDINDVIILPGTVKPTPGDYLLLDFPGIKQFLFRVNSFRHNTIQSNDFYQIDLDIKFIGTNLESKVTSQIVQTYQTVFDNIGTEDRCFIVDTDVEKINALVRSLDVIKENYMNLFYDRNVNAFTLFSPYLYEDCPIQNRCNCMEEIYDPYLAKFISNSNIYYVDNEEKSLILTPSDVLPRDFDYIFSRSIWNAILRRNLELLAPYTYYYTSRISNALSPFNIEHRETDSVKLIISDSPIDVTNTANGSNISIKSNCTVIPGTLTGEYFDSSLITQIKNKALTSTDYLDKVIYNYFNNINDEIDKDLLLQAVLSSSRKTYMYTPMIIYIVNVYYNEFFKKSENDIF
jgi:hypothetical protein